MKVVLRPVVRGKCVKFSKECKQSLTRKAFGSSIHRRERVLSQALEPHHNQDRNASPYDKSHFDMQALPNGLISLKRSLQLTGLALKILNFSPGQGYTFTHTHELQEEVYICVQGQGQIQLDDELVALTPGDMIRVSPQTKRSLYANAVSKTGYCMKSNSENFVVYVIGGVPPEVTMGVSSAAHLLDEGIPNFDDIPPWFVNDSTVMEKNAILREKFQNLSEQDSSNRRSAMLHNDGFMSNSHQSYEAKPTSPAIAVYAILLDEKRKVFVTGEGEMDAAHHWDLPGGFVGEEEGPEEALSKILNSKFSIEVHPETLIPLTFMPVNHNGTKILQLVYTCSDWHGGDKDLQVPFDWMAFSSLKNVELTPCVESIMPHLKSHIRAVKNKDRAITS